MLSISRITVVCLLASIFATVGCAPPKYYECEGVITHDGKPVPHLQIEFLPVIIDSVRTPISFTDSEGRFEMYTSRHLGIPPGKYVVQVSDPVEPDGRKTSTEPDYLYVIDRYSSAKSDYLYNADRDRLDLEIKLDTKEYIAPEANPPQKTDDAIDHFKNAPAGSNASDQEPPSAAAKPS